MASVIEQVAEGIVSDVLPEAVDEVTGRSRRIWGLAVVVLLVAGAAAAVVIVKRRGRVAQVEAPDAESPATASQVESGTS